VPLLRHLACLLLGAAVALGALAAHRSLAPLGLLVAVGSSLAVAVWLRGSRAPRTAASYVAGWLVVLAVVVAGRPEGDYLLAADLPGYALLGSALLLAVVGLVSLAGGRGSST
jgi:hypothetical protein